MSYKFQVGISSLLLDARGELAFGDIGLGLLDADPLVQYRFFTPHTPEVTPDQLAGFDGVVAAWERYTSASLAGNPRLAVIGRFGVGYDTVDVEACNEADVMLFLSPQGVQRPVASAIIAMILALSLKLLPKIEYSRTGQPKEAKPLIGTGLVAKTLGSIGLGRIGSEMFRLAAPFGMGALAYDPLVGEADAAAAGVRLVELDTLLRTADFVCVNCPLTLATTRLIGRRELGLMKPSAFLVNTARGPIVDTTALVEALRERRLAGAGLDVTDPEPLPRDHELLAMDNVIVTSHRICWTDQMFLGNGIADVEGMIRVARGQVPAAVVNRSVLERPRLREKLRRFADLAERGG